jgi:hypothetical protein
LYYRLNKSFITKCIMDESNAGFIGEPVPVDVTWDGLCTSSLSVNVFRPKGGWEAPQSNTTQLVEGHFRLTHSAPVGILGFSRSHIRGIYRDALDAALVDPKFTARVTAKHRSEVSTKTLTIVYCYWQATKSLVCFDLQLP